MKRTLLSLTIISAIIFTACSSNKQEPKRDMVLLNDSLYRSSMNTDKAAQVEEEPEEEAPVRKEKATSYRKPQRTAGTVYRNEPEPVVTAPVPAPVETPAAPAPAPSAEPPATTGTETASTGAETKPEPGAEVPAKKTGISKAAKGAIIGGVGGAVAGAVIGKKGKAAVIGGVIGATGGYILGRKKDKQDGRVENYTSAIN